MYVVYIGASAIGLSARHYTRPLLFKPLIWRDLYIYINTELGDKGLRPENFDYLRKQRYRVNVYTSGAVDGTVVYQIYPMVGGSEFKFLLWFATDFGWNQCFETHRQEIYQ